MCLRRQSSLSRGRTESEQIASYGAVLTPCSLFPTRRVVEQSACAWPRALTGSGMWPRLSSYIPRISAAAQAVTRNTNHATYNHLYRYPSQLVSIEHMFIFVVLFHSQGYLRRHRRDVRLPDPGSVEGDPLHQVPLPGVRRLPLQEPQTHRRTEAGGQAVLSCLRLRRISDTNFDGKDFRDRKYTFDNEISLLSRFLNCSESCYISYH